LIAVLLIPALLSLPLWLQLDHSQDPCDQPASLLQYKEEISRGEKPFVHVTPEAAIVYFKGFILKRLDFRGFRRVGRTPLQCGRVLSWAPPPDRPKVVLEAETLEPIDRLELILGVEDMPHRFAVLLNRGDVLAVNTDAAEAFLNEVVLEEEGSDPPSIPVLVSRRRTLKIEMPASHAREFYWLLRENMAVIY
jgi:hypothetical protein